MPYSIFLLVFLVTPIVALGWMLRGYVGRRQMVWIGALMVVALVYTTPWDNYLVATRVWWYDRALVLGATIGWVPIEEYAFFVLQPIMAGLWVLTVSRHLSRATAASHSGMRGGSTAALGMLWLTAAFLLISGAESGTYLALIALWSLPPIAVQTAFGADILWKQRRRVLWGLLPVVAYLSLADALAIRSGTWTINPEKSLEMYLGGVLPLEEFLFFVVTNALIVFAIVLLQSRESYERVDAMRDWFLVNILAGSTGSPTPRRHGVDMEVLPDGIRGGQPAVVPSSPGRLPRLHCGTGSSRTAV